MGGDEDSKARGIPFEKQTARIVKALFPSASVKHDIKIRGTLSKVDRQFDVQAADPSGYDYILFECKDHKRPIDVEVIDGFGGKLRDIGGARAAIVSNSSYSEAALNMASEIGIDCLLLVDTNDSSVRARLCATVLVRDAFVVDSGIRVSPALAKVVPTRFKTLELRDRLGSQTSGAEVFARAWNEDFVDHKPGDQEFTFGDLGFVEYRSLQGEWRSTAEVRVVVRVEERCWLGELALIDTEGLYDVRDGSYATTHMTTEALDVANLPTWEAIEPSKAEQVPATLVQYVSPPLVVRD